MNAQTRQYLFGVIFLAVGVFQLTRKDFIEASLYILAGMAFLFNTLAAEPRFMAYKRPLVIITWVLIIAAGVLFLYLLQFKFL